MATQALYRKWRSQTFAEVIGQQHVTQTLINALRLERIGHAYLFTGPRGTGKTSTARLLAKAVNCQAGPPAECPGNQCAICRAINQNRLLDLIEIDAASNTGVDDIRDLRDKVSFRPSEARVKFYIIDEAHMLSNSAFNALLKTLEEPPPHVIFVLATTEPEKIPDTITSRCQRFDFKRIQVSDVVDRLDYILTQEGLAAERSALEYIAKQGGGSMRDAISLLDQLTAYGESHITLEQVQTVLGKVTSQTVINLVEALIARDVTQGLDVINQAVGEGVEPRQFGREIVEYLRLVMLVKLGKEPSSLNMVDDLTETITRQAHQAEAQLLTQATKLFNETLQEIKLSQLAIPHLPLELAFVEAAGVKPKAASVPPQPVATPVQPAPVMQQPAIKPPSTTATSQPPPSASRQPDGLSSSLTVQTVQAILPQAFELVVGKSKVMAEVLRNQATLQAVERNEIFFAVEAEMKTRFEKPQPQQALNGIFSQVLGQPVVIRFVANTPEPTQSDEAGSNPSLIDAARKLATE